MEIKVGKTFFEKWIDFDEIQKNDLVDKYLPDRGEGENMATQAITAFYKLCYKWFNDGDVFDNTYSMPGWCNDISSYANWLDRYIDGAHDVLSHIKDCHSCEEYEHLLDCLTYIILQPELLADLEKRPAVGTIYKQRGPWRFVEQEEEEDDDDDEMEDFE